MKLKKSSADNGVSQSRLSLRKRAIILFAIALAFLAAFFCSMILQTIAYKVRGFYENSADYTIKTNSRLIEERISSYSNDLKAISAMKTVQDGNAREILNVFRNLNQLNKQFVLDLYYSDKNGVCRSPSSDTIDISGTNSFKAHTQKAQDLYISHAFMSKRFEKQTLIISKAVYGEAGDFSGIILYVLDLGCITNPIQSIPFVPQSSGFIVDDQGKFILEPKIETTLTYSPDSLDSGKSASLRSFCR